MIASVYCSGSCLHTSAYLLPLYIPPPGGEIAPGLSSRGLHKRPVYAVSLVHNFPFGVFVVILLNSM